MADDGVTISVLCARCHERTTISVPEKPVRLTCEHCSALIPLAAGGGLLEGNPVERCLRCDGEEFYVRKDFPRALGCNIVLIAAVLSFWTYMLSLVVASIIEALIYWWVPVVTTCYRCYCEYRGCPLNEEHQGFDHDEREELEGDFEPPELEEATGAAS